MYLGAPLQKPSRAQLSFRGGGVVGIEGFSDMILFCLNSISGPYEEVSYLQSSAADGRCLVLQYTALYHQGQL
jgi:hypothetical protein